MRKTIQSSLQKTWKKRQKPRRESGGMSKRITLLARESEMSFRFNQIDF